MEHFASSKFLLYTFLLFCVVATSSSTSQDGRAYIIQMDRSAMPATFSTHHDWYTSILSSLSSPDDMFPTHLYTYRHVMDGFSAVLSQDHLDQVENLSGHVATFPESVGHLLTTHTPKFLGLNRHAGLWPASRFGDDMIIGVVDTGIWPESDSFKDRKMPPVPPRWRGICEIGTEFNASHCNKKLIGARKFSKGMEQQRLNISNTLDYNSPRDFLGHGTHTSSTAAGSPVQQANYFGYARGTAIGIAPLARIAMYKVLFNSNAARAYAAAATDVLAGMDQAIEDGVDVLSLSLGFFETPFFKNPIAIGAFAAMKKGIFVACSAGNSGPHPYTMLNGAPWLTTVGAGTIDRDFGAQITVGEGLKSIIGKSIYPEKLFISNVTVYFGQGNRSKEICGRNSLNHEDVAGKIIFCDYDNETSVNTQGHEADIDGVVGAIIISDDQEYLRPHDFTFPFVVVNTKDGAWLKNYIVDHAQETYVSLTFGVTLTGIKPAPKIAYFSSRGPDISSPWILKPDLLAPGYNILATWVPNRGFAPIGDQYLWTDYAIVSGTSMACPHVAGLAALLKSIHRDWSPAAIRSAMMTTAYVTDNANGQILDMTFGLAANPLDFGAGHINPNKALDPGLVYDVEADEYVNYLCALNYTREQIQTIIGTINYTCEYESLDLNYPSFIVILNKTNTTTSTFKRVLTNVADTGSVYTASVEVSPGMKALVQPSTIYFAGKGSKAEFNLTVEINLLEAVDFGSRYGYFINYGFLSWLEVDGASVVRSPIVSATAA